MGTWANRIFERATIMDYQQMTSSCGLDCFNCPAYLANDYLKLRIDIAERLGLLPEKATCNGCRNPEGIIAFLGDQGPCVVFNCTKQKGITYCCECAEIPCDHLQPYADQAAVRQHNTKLFNLCLIKKMGVERWAEEKSLKVKQTYFQGKFSMHATDKLKS